MVTTNCIEKQGKMFSLLTRMVGKYFDSDEISATVKRMLLENRYKISVIYNYTDFLNNLVMKEQYAEDDEAKSTVTSEGLLIIGEDDVFTFGTEYSHTINDETVEYFKPATMVRNTNYIVEKITVTCNQKKNEESLTLSTYCELLIYIGKK